MTVMLLALLALPPTGAAPGDPPRTEIPLRLLGRLAHPAIREASGIVASRRHPGIFWVHNDSANPPALFAVRRDGSLVREYSVGVPNVDWEDIATDDQGHLYLGDIGNNGLRLPLRAIYQLTEPDPLQRPEATSDPARKESVHLETASYYRFPAGGRFDAEALVIDGGRALVVAKTFDRREAEVYALPMARPAPLLRPAVPERVGVLPDFREPVTGADLSPDGLLAVCSNRSIGVFQREAGGPWRPVSRVEFRVDDSIEAIAWEHRNLILAGEGRGVFGIDEVSWRKTRPLSPAAAPSREAVRP